MHGPMSVPVPASTRSTTFGSRWSSLTARQSAGTAPRARIVACLPSESAPQGRSLGLGADEQPERLGRPVPVYPDGLCGHDIYSCGPNATRRRCA
jgi:hypothetical protein